MSLPEPTVYQLICDLACKLEDEQDIGGQFISSYSESMESDHVKNNLVTLSGVDYGDDLLAWADWYLKNRYVIDNEKGILYLIRVIGRRRNIIRNT